MGQGSACRLAGSSGAEAPETRRDGAAEEGLEAATKEVRWVRRIRIAIATSRPLPLRVSEMALCAAAARRILTLLIHRSLAFFGRAGGIQCCRLWPGCMLIGMTFYRRTAIANPQHITRVGVQTEPGQPPVCSERECPQPRSDSEGAGTFHVRGTISGFQKLLLFSRNTHAHKYLKACLLQVFTTRSLHGTPPRPKKACNHPRIGDLLKGS